jgi:hypothetical protein
LLYFNTEFPVYAIGRRPDDVLCLWARWHSFACKLSVALRNAAGEIDMITELRHVLSALIARIADKLIELDRLSKVDASHVLGEPASMEEIEAFVAGRGIEAARGL